MFIDEEGVATVKIEMPEEIKEKVTLENIKCTFNEKSLDLILNDIQSNEELTLYISESDIENINELKLKTGKRSEELKRIRIETRDGLQKGGCILESNYGIMDASIEQRVNKVRGTLLERLPHVDSVKITENHHLNDQGLSVEVHEDELNQENDPKDDES